MAKVSTFVIIRIPLPLPKPRHSITQAIRVDHEGDVHEGAVLEHGLRPLIHWAEHHEGDMNRNSTFPAEWATRSYLKLPILFTPDTQIKDVLEQLKVCGAKVRMVTAPADFPWHKHIRELFAEPDVFEQFAMKRPSELFVPSLVSLN